MERTIEDITTELIKLSKKDRLEVARFLLFLDNRSIDSNDVDLSWEKEITERVRAVEQGKATGIDYAKAMKSIEKRFES